MRTVQRTPDKALLRDAAAIAAAMVAVGASFGAIAIAYGLPTWVPFLMSTAVFAGGAQFLAVGLIAAGNPIAAVLAGLLLNARHLPFGLAVSETIGPRWRDRLIGSHLMTDETVAFTLAEKDPVRRRRTYWLIGLTLFTSWNTGTVLGVLLGGAASDPSVLGLDAAFPAGLIALILPALRDRDTRLVALTGAGVAVLLTPVLPTGLPVLCALLGLAALFRARRFRRTPPAADPEAAGGPGGRDADRGPGGRDADRGSGGRDGDRGLGGWDGDRGPGGRDADRGPGGRDAGSGRDADRGPDGRDADRGSGGVGAAAECSAGGPAVRSGAAGEESSC